MKSAGPNIAKLFVKIGRIIRTILLYLALFSGQSIRPSSTATGWKDKFLNAKKRSAQALCYVQHNLYVMFSLNYLFQLFARPH